MKSADSMKLDLAAYTKFKHDIEWLTFEDGEHLLQEMWVNYRDTIDILLSPPPWLIAHFIEMANILANKLFTNAFESLVNGYLSKMTMDDVFKMLSSEANSKENSEKNSEGNEIFNDWAKILLLWYGIKYLHVDLCKVLIEKHKVSPNSIVSINFGTYDEYSGELIHYLQYNKRKHNEYMIILKLLLKAGSNIFSTYEAACFDVYQTFISSLNSGNTLKSAELKKVVLLLFTYGLGFMRSLHRFPMFGNKKRKRIKDVQIDTIVDLLKCDPSPVAKDSKATEHVNKRKKEVEVFDCEDLCNEELVRKMFLSPIAIKIQLQNEQWKWVFSLEELKKILENYEDLSESQKTRIQFLSKFIRDPESEWGYLLERGLEKTFCDFHKTRTDRLMITAFELFKKSFPHGVCDLVVGYLENPVMVKEFTTEKLEKRKGIKINCCVHQ